MANPIRSFLDRSNDDPVKTVGVAVTVALTCALVVSLTSVTLRPLQDAHIAAERQARVDAMIDALPGLRDLMLETGVDALETRMVDLETDSFTEAIDADGFDTLAAAADPERSIALAAEDDPAGLMRRTNFAPVYLLAKEGALQVLVLPVHGHGYASTIRAYLALEPDLETIAALTVIDQGETPGLGARIAEPEWQALWPGRALANADGELAIEVVRGEATELWQVDGISGATRTGNGVTNMLRFWLGPIGFGPFLERLKAEGLE